MSETDPIDPAPLRFHPIFQDYIWGGQRLYQQFKKARPGERCAESWELVDHADHQSTVSEGIYQGQTLSQLIQRFGPSLLGTKVWQQVQSPNLPANLQRRFPLLFKFLDAAKTLSVQVHPNDCQAAQLSPADLGKTEAWLVLAAEPDALIYAGLKQPTSVFDLSQALQSGQVEDLLYSFTPQPGDCVFIPAGTIHALGAGLVVAEIQQASNTTYRLFDWNRVDQHGKSRPLHVEAALKVSILDQGPVRPTAACSTGFGWQVRVACPYFQLCQVRGQGSFQQNSTGNFQIFVLLSGRSQLTWHDRSGRRQNHQLAPGDTVLVPATLGKFEVELSEDADLLAIHPAVTAA